MQIHGSKYFKVWEFVPPEVYDVWGARSQWFIDPKLIAVCDALREIVGAPITVNNWFNNPKGQFRYRGLRTPRSEHFKPLSQHTAGRAADINARGLTSRQLYAIIQANAAVLMALGLTTVENIKDTKGWVHIDVRPRIDGVHEVGKLLVVSPS